MKKFLLCFVSASTVWSFLMLDGRPAHAIPLRGSCAWSITAACASVRNGGSYTRDGITHRYVGRKPNGRMRFQVYLGNARVK